MQLRRVVEMAGMLEHCDFDEQVTTDGTDGRVRPDMVVHLPGAKQVVVDAKVPLQAFLDANDATDDEARRGHMQAHARHLRNHVDALAKKAYWQQFDDSPGFVVAFVPGDPLLAAALEHDPTLLEHAVANNVLLATPTTLIALLRTVAYGWQQEALAENAREVQLMARELYKRLAIFGDHMARTGRSLSGAVEAYNKAVGSLERNVFPQARRFHDLGVVSGGDKEMPELGHIDAVPRDLHAPELAGPRLALAGDTGLELIEGSGPDHLELPDAAAT
jgi:DNA recombination protein RmuC